MLKTISPNVRQMADVLNYNILTTKDFQNVKPLAVVRCAHRHLDFLWAHLVFAYNEDIVQNNKA